MQTKSARWQAQARPRAHIHTQNNTMRAALIWKSQKLAKIVRLMHSSQGLSLTTRMLMCNKISLIILEILHYVE
jgi:hypothetical protein